MSRLARQATIAAPADRVFAYVDDIRNLARHMSERGSMPMMGSKLKLEILSPQITGTGATYRYSGSVLGLPIDFSETVTAYRQGRAKVWHTIGRPRLLIIDSYEMRIEVEPIDTTTSKLTISFDYELPGAGFWRWAGQLLAPVYARWCLDSMIEGTVKDVSVGVP